MADIMEASNSKLPSQSLDSPSNSDEKNASKQNPITTFLPQLSWTDAMNNLAAGKWLRVSVNTTDLREQFINENVNVSLVSALFVTVAQPSSYGHVNHAEDIFASWLGQKYPDTVSTDTLHDILQFGFMMSEGFFIISTIIGVFFAMAANECEDDAKTQVLVNALSSFAQVPYYSFSIGIIFYSLSYWTFAFVAPLSMYTTIAVYVVGILLVFVSVLITMPRMVTGVYLAHASSEAFDYHVMSEEQLSDKLANLTAGSVEVTLEVFLESCRPVSPQGYCVPLSDLTRMRAVKVYLADLAKRLGVSQQEAIQYFDASRRVP
eukprot:gb/GEZN01010353.1/.p1 GENE.gb/GEZN01010353.1/~~gb/GEZN01010353.1/.p1  ORF type:complete len:320 (-),score=39.37 gb/GEZN01010353.1/:247-1206(-)